GARDRQVMYPRCGWFGHSPENSSRVRAADGGEQHSPAVRPHLWGHDPRSVGAGRLAAAPWVTHVAMERTGVPWRPVFTVLEEEGRRLLLVNAQHVKALPGRTTDVKDSEWLADPARAIDGCVPALSPPTDPSVAQSHAVAQVARPRCATRRSIDCTKCWKPPTAN